ncbi:hypothetical protein UY3_18049 [Chelonia mydas]|uniref:Uncharacterized protein n=1 Tax=Chelonia mydas TaxID=8469 RepID=M7AYN5_CHEMY|nr:hypothetical protein UY3_18049 [Chelonia mydas]
MTSMFCGVPAVTGLLQTSGKQIHFFVRFPVQFPKVKGGDRVHNTFRNLCPELKDPREEKLTLEQMCTWPELKFPKVKGGDR